MKKMTRMAATLLAAAMLMAMCVFAFAAAEENTQKNGSMDETDDAALSPDVSDKNSRTLVVYFSATESTEAVAKIIADEQNAVLFELVPTIPYTSDDLNRTKDGGRVNHEHDDEALRNIPLTSAAAKNWDGYDMMFIGYPIW